MKSEAGCQTISAELRWEIRLANRQPLPRAPGQTEAASYAAGIVESSRLMSTSWEDRDCFCELPRQCVNPAGLS